MVAYNIRYLYNVALQSLPKKDYPLEVARERPQDLLRLLSIKAISDSREPNPTIPNIDNILPRRYAARGQVRTIATILAQYRKYTQQEAYLIAAFIDMFKLWASYFEHVHDRQRHYSWIVEDIVNDIHGTYVDVKSAILMFGTTGNFFVYTPHIDLMKSLGYLDYRRYMQFPKMTQQRRDDNNNWKFNTLKQQAIARLIFDGTDLYRLPKPLYQAVKSVLLIFDEL